MRRRFNFYFLLVFLPSVAACTGLSSRTSGDGHPLPGVVAKGVVAKKDPPRDTLPRPVEARPVPNRPAGPMSGLIYDVLVGQVARQRGEYRVAFTHFLRGARLARDPGLAELAASVALVLGDADAIREAADTWLDLAPDSVGAHQLAAYAYLEADDVSRATEHLRRLIALAAQDGRDGYVQAARLISKLKLPERRLKLMETLTAEDPESADAWFARSVVAAGAEKHEEAVAAARRAADLRPTWNQPRIFLVQLLLSHGDRKQAREMLEAFVADSPDDHGLRLLYAQLLVDEQEFSRARNVFEHMLRKAPKEPDVLFALGVLSLQLKDSEAARDYFAKLRGTGERQGDAFYYLGQVEELAENPDAAVTWYRKVEGEHALDAQVRIAQMSAERGKIERAREILHQLRDQWPEEAPTLFLIEAATLADRDLPQQAMDVYDEALQAFPGDPEILYARGLHASSMNRLDIMEADMKAIIAKDPEHADALNALGYCLADQTKRYTEAQSYIERALALKPDDPAVLDSMGWVQFRLGKPEEALGYLRKALALMPDGEIAAHLGEVLWAMGRRDEAWSIWKGALAREPDHEYLLSVTGRHRVSRTDPQP
jgi:tetratricopeptide (TPR) repeat protein